MGFSGGGPLNATLSVNIVVSPVNDDQKFYTHLHMAMSFGARSNR